ncbi:MAG TPA: histidine kinase dimerization/phospho-acceptor domain-containing protein, partial [Burkholderiaceae bacterium]|nr:histidine kinase dimerization/phospho-acceptor domain-containing protein [Burkholderiaceae bacterium]
GLFKRIDTALERERRFTADAAHELRTPLAALRAQWDVLRGAQDEAQKKQAIERLGAGIERMGRLVTQLLLLSRIEAAQGLDKPQSIDWPTLVQQSVNDVFALAQRRQIELACTWPAHSQTPWPLKGDADLIGILLRNLLDNAVRYSPPGSTVTLSLEADGLRVHNEGPPLSDQIMTHLGERFHRPDGQAETGSGLGISIAQRIAALHGLRLRFGADADGQGVLVTVRVDRA